MDYSAELNEIAARLQAIAQEIQAPDPDPVPDPDPAPIPEPEPEPTPTGDIIWKFSPKDIPHNYTSETKSSKYQEFTMKNGYSFAVSKNNMMPRITQTGLLDTVMWYTPDRTTSHTMLRPVHKTLKSGISQLGTTYKFNMTAQPQGSNINEYSIILQGWGPGYPDNSKWFMPPMSLYTLGGQWVGAIRPGSTLNGDHESVTFKMPCQEKQFADIEVLYRPSHTNGLFRVTIDDHEMCDYAGPTVLKNRKDSGPIIMIGTYTYASAKRRPVGYIFKNILISTD